MDGVNAAISTALSPLSRLHSAEGHSAAPRAWLVVSLRVLRQFECISQSLPRWLSIIALS